VSFGEFWSVLIYFGVFRCTFPHQHLFHRLETRCFTLVFRHLAPAILDKREEEVNRHGVSHHLSRHPPLCSRAPHIQPHRRALHALRALSIINTITFFIFCNGKGIYEIIFKDVFSKKKSGFI
jgi:hypothetical protein